MYRDQRRQAASGSIDYGNGIRLTREAWRHANRNGVPDLSIFAVPPQQSRVIELIELGFNRLVFGLPSADADTAIPLLDRLATLAGDINAQQS